MSTDGVSLLASYKFQLRLLPAQPRQLREQACILRFGLLGAPLRLFAGFTIRE